MSPSEFTSFVTDLLKYSLHFWTYIFVKAEKQQPDNNCYNLSVTQNVSIIFHNFKASQ